MTPPERLRLELQRLRERGYSFTQAWPAAVSHALRGESLGSAIFWRSTFNEQRPIWAVSYSRAPWPANKRPVLILPDDDRSSPATRTRPLMVVA